jgi:hypothetical protein
LKQLVTFSSAIALSGTRWCYLHGPGCQVLVYDGVGLNVAAGGIVDLDTVTADNNTVTGAHLEGSNIFIVDSTFNNTAPATPSSPPADDLRSSNLI